MAGLTESYCRSNETSHASQFKWLDNTFKETAEIETGMAEKSSWDQANRRQNLGLVWRNRKKISQIIKDYFCLPFFLFIMLWRGVGNSVYLVESSRRVNL